MRRKFLITRVLFQSTPPLRGATNEKSRTEKDRRFQSTPPLRGATIPEPVEALTNTISIHAPLAGGDSIKISLPSYENRFQSTPPLRGATGKQSKRYKRYPISIHAPLAGGDSAAAVGRCIYNDFNPRPPCGGRPEYLNLFDTKKEFQSTPPLRGATVGSDDMCPEWDISIHAPLAGGDAMPVVFQRHNGISIHAPLAGGDLRETLIGILNHDFNPRPPCGGRRGGYH